MSTHRSFGVLRRVRRVSTVTAVALGVLAGPVVAADSNDWPQMGHDAAHSYANPGESTLKPGRFKDLRLLWTAVLDSQGPSIVGAGRMITCVRPKTITALDDTSGAPLWQHGGLPGSKGCGVAATDGSTVWLASSRNFCDPGYVLALEPSTGVRRWQRRLSNPLSESLRTQLVHDGDTLYISDLRSVVHALSAQSGATRWRAATACSLNVPTAGGGRVFLSTNACDEGSPKLIALDATDGAVLWSQALGTDRYQAPLLQGGRVFIYTGTGWVRAFDAATGTPLWARQVEGHFLPPPMVGGGDTVFANSLGTIYAFDAATGTLRWQTAVPREGKVNSNMALAAGSLFHTVLDTDLTQRLSVVNATTGQPGPRSPAALIDTVVYDLSTLTVAGGRVQVASKGRVYVFGLPAH